MARHDFNGTALAYDVVGDGDVVVLVHGSWNERRPWAFVAQRLADSFRLVSYDRRGHGESGGLPEEGTVHDDVADLAALIEGLDAVPANIVGSSFGACITLRLAAERPSLVRRVVVHEPPFLSLLDTSPATRSIAEATLKELDVVRERLEAGDGEGAAQYFVENVALGPGAWTMIPAEMRANFVANAPTYLGEIRDPDAWVIDPAALAEISAPVLLTQGDQSPAFFAPIADVVAGLVPSVSRRTVEGAGHVPHVTHPDVYAPLVRSFLADA